MSDASFEGVETSHENWLPPVTMPSRKPPCRHVWTIGKVEAVQVKDINTPEMIHKINASLQKIAYNEKCYEFRNWYTTTYPDASLDDWWWWVERLTEETKL